jgi:glycosyltransferase involved in cell wall biosynthesis
LAWDETRRIVVARRWHRPKISALMVTGRCLERYSLTRVAIDCFFDQTWPNKELVIVNHGPWSLTQFMSQERKALVNEVMVYRPEEMTLGDLRNLSMDVASGEWLIQWDDDDWHHPLRMETQFDYADSADTINTLGWQVRCNLQARSAFYDVMPGGQHMSVFYAKDLVHRYEKLNVREDTAFFSSFARRTVIDNSPDNVPVSPFLYVRLFHTLNIWDQQHIMGGSNQDQNWNSSRVDLNEWHLAEFNEILAKYDDSLTQFNSELSIAGYEERHISNFRG